MKKIFLLIAAASFTVVACDVPQTPVNTAPVEVDDDDFDFDRRKKARRRDSANIVRSSSRSSSRSSGFRSSGRRR